MGIISEEIGRYDPYTDKFIKNTTTSRIEVDADGTLHNLSISNSYGLYAKNQEELDKCDYIDKSTKLYTEDEVIAILTELQQEIEEIVKEEGGLINKKWANGLHYSEKIIQQKIDALKGANNE